MYMRCILAKLPFTWSMVNSHTAGYNNMLTTCFSFIVPVQKILCKIKCMNYVRNVAVRLNRSLKL